MFKHLEANIYKEEKIKRKNANIIKKMCIGLIHLDVSTCTIVSPEKTLVESDTRERERGEEQKEREEQRQFNKLMRKLLVSQLQMILELQRDELIRIRYKMVVSSLEVGLRWLHECRRVCGD
jgi:hypothetical protein